MEDGEGIWLTLDTFAIRSAKGAIRCEWRLAQELKEDIEGA